MDLSSEHFSVKLAETQAELVAAQRLRYRVFVQETGAHVSTEDHKLGIERDAFDPICDHLIIIDNRIKDADQNVIGAYRLLDDRRAREHDGFYGAGEFDLTVLRQSGLRLLELGRSCVDPAYRGGLAVHLLWSGLAQHIVENQVDILFGAASFAGTDPGKYADALSFLHHGHLAPAHLRVAAHGPSACQTDLRPKDQVDRLAAMRQMPPLIKAYLRLGGVVGQGAYIDHQFNTIDVCLVMDTAKISAKHKAQYIRGAA